MTRAGAAVVNITRARKRRPAVVKPRDPIPTARSFLKRAKAPLLRQADVFFEWDGAAYRELPLAEVRTRLYGFLEQCRVRNNKGGTYPFAPNRHKVSDVEDALRALVNLAGTVSAPAWLSDDHPGLDPFDFISLSNGLLWVPGRALLDPTPDFFTFTALPFEYDADAPRPDHWLEFVEGLWPNDPAPRETLQEWTGLLLTTITRFQKILLLVGPPRSGKGVWSRVVRQLVGPRNYHALTLRSLADSFGAQALIGKSVVVATDARLSSRVDGIAVAERLLAISGEDSPAVQRKCLPDWEGTLSSRFTLLTNELPQITDASGALTSRFIVLRLTESHLDKEDLELEPRLVPELPGILNWGLDGLDRLLKRGHFVQPESARELVEQLTELGSPIGAFLEEQCEICEDFEVERSSLFDRWDEWCESTGHKKGNAALFGRDLRAALPNLKNGYRGHRKRVYKGLRLLDRGPQIAILPR
ncbi:MAG: NTP-binding protein [Acidobacteria bacterium]|nr:NTP-binding protein [Acidobacteriota bacterium]